MNGDEIAYELGYQLSAFLSQRYGASPSRSGGGSSIKKTIYRRLPNGDVEVVEVTIPVGEIE